MIDRRIGDSHGLTSNGIKLVGISILFNLFLINGIKGNKIDVVKDSEILNKEGLRNNKEFVNHKILDCMGDIYLSGYKMIANVKCSQGGHKLTNQVLRKVFENKENYSIIEIKEKYLPHTLVTKSQLKSIA